MSSFPTEFHYKNHNEEQGTQATYAENTSSKLVFKSMVTGHSVTFKAFLTEYAQRMDTTWNTEQVFGRMDPLATFQGTKRSISLGWTIPAGFLAEAKNNALMINGLVAMLYPGYSKNNVEVDGTNITTASSIAKPPLIKIKFANLITSSGGKSEDGLLGYVDGFSINPDLEMGLLIEDKKQYFKVINISCNFNVLHQHDVGFDNEGNWLDGEGYKDWIFGDSDE
tara:strand:+ start:124 stop:795 length:672 start_codon:yes stop_codon:yes gene_type:complete